MVAPTDINQLTIEYSGDEVVCTTTQLNSDSSVYLARCTVGGRSVEGYTYGKGETTPKPITPTYTSYQVGDHVSYNGVTYYVIEDSDTTNNKVKLLKENPLTKTEIDALNLSGITVTESNSYGKVQYGSSVDYSTSTVKQVVDAWKNTAVASGDTATARLITKDEIDDNFTMEEFDCCGGCGFCKANRFKDTWMYNNQYNYWTISENDFSFIWRISDSGGLDGHYNITNSSMVRPVLELNKSADITKLAS